MLNEIEKKDYKIRHLLKQFKQFETKFNIVEEPTNIPDYFYWFTYRIIGSSENYYLEVIQGKNHLNNRIDIKFLVELLEGTLEECILKLFDIFQEKKDMCIARLPEYDKEKDEIRTFIAHKPY